MKNILMTKENAQKCFEGTKTQTRRIITPQPPIGWDAVLVMQCSKPKYAVGELAYIAEPWHTSLCKDFIPPNEIVGHGYPIWYGNNDVTWKGAEVGGRGFVTKGRYRHAISMPESFARTIVEITGVKAERMSEISLPDILAEGIEKWEHDDGYTVYRNYQTGGDTIDPLYSFETLWESINGLGSSAHNRWVFAYTFRRVNK